MEPIINEELIHVAMGILTHAGDARLACKQALQAVREFHFEQAAVYMAEAKKEITQAHSAQTMIIQNEARGTSYEYCMLFNHAQDTLMSINSEIELAKELIAVFVSIDQRMRKVEKHGKHS